MTGHCDNCLVATATLFKVAGYQACKDCFTESCLPPHLRKD